MSSKVENSKMHYANNIFKIHPMWNYKYYLIIDMIDNSNYKHAIALGFRTIKIINNDLNEFYDVNSRIAFESILENPTGIKLKCSEGITHDSEFNRYIQDYDNKILPKCNLTLLHIEQSKDTYEKRIKNNYKTIKSIKSSWILNNVNILDFKLKGIDCMYNEIMIKKISFSADSINFLSMNEEMSENKAFEAVSRLF